MIVKNITTSRFAKHNKVDVALPRVGIVLVTGNNGEGKSTISVTGDLDTAVTTTGAVVEQLTTSGELDLIAAGSAADALGRHVALAPRAGAGLTFRDDRRR